MKLGRKKRAALSRSSRLALGWGLIGGDLDLHLRWDRKVMAAVPVTEAESRMVGPKEPDRLAVNPSINSGDEGAR